MTRPWETLFHHATAHGVLSAIALPEDPAPVPATVLERLDPAEQELAVTMRGYRQVQFVGGRIALRLASAQLGIPLPASLPDDRGTPRLPPKLAGSVSHKQDIAVGMVARHGGATLGVDIENYRPERMSVLPKVLRPEELAAIEALPEQDRWLAALLRFSIKESIYKAIDPYVRRYVGFQEALVVPDLEGRAMVTMFLERDEGPFAIDARYLWLEGRLLTSVRIRPQQPPD